jgi:superfamily II DNA or RNA helicase
VSSERKSIVFHRYFNVVSFKSPPGDNRIAAIMGKYATVARRVSTRERGKIVYDTEIEPCYREEWVDTKLIYTVGVGLCEKLGKAFAQLGYAVDMVDVNPAGIDGFRRLLPNTQRLNEIPWRADQRDIVEDIIRRQHGQYQLSTGAGKSFMIPKLCEVFDKARILITTVGVGLLQDMYHKMMQEGRVDAGIYTSKNNDPAGRVLLCSLGTVPRFTDREFDLMFVDEKHECATLRRMESLLMVNARKAFAFSADDDNRIDGADAWLEVIFGSTRRKITHIDSVRAGDIVPVRVSWIKVRDNKFKTSYRPGTDGFDRHVYRDNPVRNLTVADTAKQVKSAGQTLVYVSKVEHAYRLRKLLDCPVAHAKRTPEEWDYLKQLDLVGKQEKSPTEQDLLQLRRRASVGDEQLVICNSVWKRGVDFPHLRSLVRADASTSAIDATQISGRLTRKSEGKLYGELFDFDDSFCQEAKARAEKRRVLYRKLNYQQSPMPT